MKKIIVLICLTLLLVNCSSDDNQAENEENQTGNTLSYSKGAFIDGAHPTSGVASVSTNKTELKFSKFKTDAGPKLVVYLTTAVGSNDYISLGDLKGIDGDYTYSIPANTDLDTYTIVDIWCVDFSVSFGHAELRK